MLKYIALFLPYFLSLLLSSNPDISYMVSWSGSLYIMAISMYGKVRKIPDDLPMSSQIMRPLFLTQALFASFNCLSSLFFYLSSHGYYYFTDVYEPAGVETIALIAKAQRYLVLGHASMVCGILAGMSYKESKYIFFPTFGNAKRTLTIAGLFFLLALMVNPFTGLMQFYFKFVGIYTLGSIAAFVCSLAEKKLTILAISGVAYACLFTQSLLSGWRHRVILNIVFLLSLLYSRYKKLAIIGALVAIPIILTFLPLYGHLVRKNSWSGDMLAVDASDKAIEMIRTEKVNLEEFNWDFLQRRASEITILMKYVDKCPKDIDYYGSSILVKSIQGLLPRALSKDKFSLEESAMERARRFEIVKPHSLAVSAKASFIADGYISAGAIGVFIIMFMVGLASSYASVTAERLFGGYLVGTGVFYTGLFPIFWVGTSMEFLFNTVFWSFVTMYIISHAGRFLGFIKDTRRTSLTEKMTHK